KGVRPARGVSKSSSHQAPARCGDRAQRDGPAWGWFRLPWTCDALHGQQCVTVEADGSAHESPLEKARFCARDARDDGADPSMCGSVNMTQDTCGKQFLPNQF